MLTRSERDLLAALHDFFASAHQRLDSGDPLADLPDLVNALDGRLAGSRSLSIGEAALCTGASGFGVYDAFTSYDGAYKFIAGRRRKLVVYTDLTNFTSTPAMRGGVSGYEVALVQDLKLYHYSKDRDTLAWRKPDAEVVDFCRRPRRDFYIAHLIELPETLSVGTYRLKVGVRDRASGDRAETVIPIEIVADVSAFAAGG